MKILVTGANGYLGYPLVFKLTHDNKHDIVGIDNNFREEWVSKIVGSACSNCGGYLNYDRYTEIIGDLTDQDFINEILTIHKPDVIIHLASQPSMPYSQINAERALFTQTNNLIMCLNLLWGIKTNELKCRFIITTTTGIPGQQYPVIPEDYTLNMAGSWYHASRGFDSVNCRLAVKQWEQEVIEFRTSIVYGIQTELMRNLQISTRFDTDKYFGTVLNRFVQQAIDGKALTVYGRGDQSKPFISLEDTVASLINAIDYKFPKGHTILNQTTEMLSINRLADIIQIETSCKVAHMLNPRNENEEHEMFFDNARFLKVLNNKPQKAKDEIPKMIEYLKGVIGAESV